MLTETLLFMCLVWVLIQMNRNVPGPMPLPLFGNILDFLGRMDVATHKLVRQYGDVVKIWLGTEPAVIVAGEAAKYVLHSPKHIARWCHDEGLAQVDMCNRGVVMNSHLPRWRSNRNFFKTGLSMTVLRVAVPVTVKNTTKLIESVLNEMKDSKSINIAKHVMDLSLDTIGELALGQPLTSHGNFSHLIGNFMKAWNFFTFTPPLIWKTLKRAEAQKHVQAQTEMKNMEMKIIQKRRQALEGQELDEQGKKDFLTNLLLSNDGEAPIQDDQVQENLREMILGGSDTTANNLTFALYELAKQPQLQLNILEEINEILGPRDPEYEDLSKFKYLQKFINENLRMHPPIPNTIRKSLEDDTVNGYFFPAGTSFIIAIHPSEMDAKRWPNPDTFDVSRWDNNHKDVHIPFGGGYRTCPGQALAQLEMKTAIITLLRKLNFSLSNPDSPLLTDCEVVLTPRNKELWLNVEARGSL